MSDFISRLDISLDQAGFEKRQLDRIRWVSKVCNVSERSVRRWYNRESEPHLKHLDIIANQLAIRTEWLQSGEGDFSSLPSSLRKESIKHDSFSLPIFSMEDAYLFCTGSSENLTLDSYCIEPKSSFHSSIRHGNLFSIVISNEDNMAFNTGGIGYFEKTSLYSHGDYIFVKVHNLDKAIIRKICNGKPKRLIADHPAQPNILMDKKDKVLAVMVGYNPTPQIIKIN